MQRDITDISDTPIRVLILDDERFDRHRLARFCSGLPQHCDIHNAQTLADFSQNLKSAAYDLILVDYNLPDGTGLDALKRIRMSQANVNAAIIMITGLGQDDIAQAALAGGCADYLTKDELSAPAFQRAVTNALQKSRLTTQVVAQTYRRTEVEAVLEHFATQCARDVKPMLSRMMRQIRDLRAGEALPEPDAPSRFDAIEESCAGMWDFLVSLERYQAGDLMKDAPLPEAVSQPTPRRKPPSPFSRLGH